MNLLTVFCLSASAIILVINFIIEVEATSGSSTAALEGSSRETTGRGKEHQISEEEEEDDINSLNNFSNNPHRGK